jgi:hypothetical protein
MLLPAITVILTAGLSLIGYQMLRALKEMDKY